MTDLLTGLIYILVFPGFIFLVVYALLFEAIDRRITARMQDRVGPPLIQPFADFIKMLGKEVIDIDGTDRRVFDAAPVVALAAVMTAFLFVPVFWSSPFAFQGDLILIIYLLTIPTIILFIIGWLSRNVFSSIGGTRVITQMFIYEVPFFLALLTPCLMTGTWSVSEIVSWQQQNTWLFLLQPIGFIVALIGLQAKLERPPFDIPEAETEIVAGPWTELTGRRLALMHLAQDISLVTGSALVAALFLGGPSLPWVITPAWLAVPVGFVLFILKTLFVLLVLSSVKVATGRIRIDQLNAIGWKYIASASLLQVAIVLIINYYRVAT